MGEQISSEVLILQTQTKILVIPILETPKPTPLGRPYDYL